MRYSCYLLPATDRICYVKLQFVSAESQVSIAEIYAINRIDIYCLLRENVGGVLVFIVP